MEIKWLFPTLFILTNSCQSHLNASIPSNENRSQSSFFNDKTIPLSEMKCDQLINKAQDNQFLLKGLASLRAQKYCPPFKADIPGLSSIERKFYSEEIEDLIPKKSPSQPLTSQSTLEELKENLKQLLTHPSTSDEKFKAFKALRSKQKSIGLRSDYLKTTADLYNWSKSEWMDSNTPKKPLKKSISKKSEIKSVELSSEEKAQMASRLSEATQVFVKSLWTESRLEQAENILSDSLRMLKNQTSIAEIYFLKARINEEKMDFESAVINFDLALEDIKNYAPKNLSFTSEKIMWLKAWILYKNKNWPQAEKAMAELAAVTTDTHDKSKSLFYQSRCLTQLDKKEEAKKLLTKITQDDNFTYYSLVSYYELGTKLPAFSKLKFIPQFSFNTELTFLSNEESSLFKELIRYKELEIAERSILFLSKSIDKQVNLGLYLAQNGSRFLSLFGSFSKLDNNSKTEVLVKYPDLIFPKPYFNDVQKMAEKTDLPTSLIYSIMKQESAFNERTRSHADAFGLMQVIPRLAKHLSKKFKVEYKNSSDLFKPEINIQLGSYELMEQVKKQSGQLTYVAAAYNAGPNALANWLKNRKRDDLVEFIEEIPYDETRTYVKIIARNKLFYERIAKKDEDIDFPKEFIQKINLPNLTQKDTVSNQDFLKNLKLKDLDQKNLDQKASDPKLTDPKLTDPKAKEPPIEYLQN